MLGMLRRARERREAWEASCPCNQTCRCHQPEKGISPGWILAGFGALILVLVFTAGPLPPKQIVVGSQVCDVVFVKTGEEHVGLAGHRDLGYEKAVNCRPSR